MRFSPLTTSAGSCAQCFTDCIATLITEAISRGRDTMTGDVRHQDAGPVLIDRNEIVEITSDGCHRTISGGNSKVADASYRARINQNQMRSVVVRPGLQPHALRKGAAKLTAITKHQTTSHNRNNHSTLPTGTHHPHTQALPHNTKQALTHNL